MAKTNVLFVCVENSCRSQMAEGLMRSLGAGQWEVKRAGILPSFVHPIAIQVMKEIGIDISHQTSKSVEQFFNEVFDYTITLCDYAATVCPTFPGQGRRLHWPFEDPAAVIGTTEQRLVFFRKIRGQIKRRTEDFLKTEEP